MHAPEVAGGNEEIAAIVKYMAILSPFGPGIPDNTVSDADSLGPNRCVPQKMAPEGCSRFGPSPPRPLAAVLLPVLQDGVLRIILSPACLFDLILEREVLTIQDCRQLCRMHSVIFGHGFSELPHELFLLPANDV